jgi:hypothetical protein
VGAPAATGAPHVPLTITNAAAKGSLTFTNWNAPLVVHAPAGAVDLAQLSRS